MDAKKDIALTLRLHEIPAVEGGVDAVAVCCDLVADEVVQEDFGPCFDACCRIGRQDVVLEQEPGFVGVGDAGDRFGYRLRSEGGGAVEGEADEFTRLGADGDLVVPDSQGSAVADWVAPDLFSADCVIDDEVLGGEDVVLAVLDVDGLDGCIQLFFPKEGAVGCRQGQELVFVFAAVDEKMIGCGGCQIRVRIRVGVVVIPIAFACGRVYRVDEQAVGDGDEPVTRSDSQVFEIAP